MLSAKVPPDFTRIWLLVPRRVTTCRKESLESLSTPQSYLSHGVPHCPWHSTKLDVGLMEALSQPTAYEIVAYLGRDLQTEQLLFPRLRYAFLSLSTSEFYLLHCLREHCLATQQQDYTED